MAKYRHNLPQLGCGAFLTDGGLETTLIFHEGVELPHFASFVLLENEQGRAKLVKYYEDYLTIARSRGVGFILDTATWRANPEWSAKLGYGPRETAAINTASVKLLEELREKWETPTTPCVINGVIGPRGDGYKSGRMEADEAAEYHALQVSAFAETAVDMVSAITMNTVNEAVGIARAAKAHAMPCVISFTVETDGKLADGTGLRAAIEAVDRATGRYPLYFMINCAHPTHFDHALERGEPWVGRIWGIRANASAKSHAELDESETLDEGDPVDLGSRYRALSSKNPAIRIFGGCCGTDHRHIAAICEAVLPQAASAG